MHSWERQKGEKDHEWRGFQIFLNQEIRNRAAVAREIGLSSTRVYTISKLWSWVDRARDRDNWKQSIKDDTTKTELEDITREHLRGLRTARELGEKSLTRWLAVLEDPDANPVQIKEALSLLKETVLLERVILGGVTERSETTWDLSKLSPEQIRELRRLKELAGVSDG